VKIVFLDTVELLALWEKRDQWHTSASEAMKTLQAERATLIATSAIFLECGNAAARKPYRAEVADLCAELSASGRLIAPTPADERQAWQNYRIGSAGEAGIIDHISFVVMQRLGITDAFTNDRHFKTAGFKTLF
jgi:uncharacterized protein